MRTASDTSPNPQWEPVDAVCPATPLRGHPGRTRFARRGAPCPALSVPCAAQPAGVAVVPSVGVPSGAGHSVPDWVDSGVSVGVGDAVAPGHAGSSADGSGSGVVTGSLGALPPSVGVAVGVSTGVAVGLSAGVGSEVGSAVAEGLALTDGEGDGDRVRELRLR